MTCEPASPSTPQLPWSPGWRRYVPVPAAPSATPPASAARAGTARRVLRCPARAPRRAHRPPRDSARSRPSRPLRGRPAHRGALAHRGGDHPERLRSEAAWAHMCAAAPIPASSGKTVRTGSTLAATARPATPCGASYSPAWALTRPPAPTSSTARAKENPSRRSSAASSATSPARSTPACAPLLTDPQAPGTA